MNIQMNKFCREFVSIAFATSVGGGLERLLNFFNREGHALALYRAWRAVSTGRPSVLRLRYTGNTLGREVTR